MGKMTARKIDQLISVLNRTGGCVKTSCQAIGISRPTFYTWKEKSKKLARAFEESRHNMILDVEQALYDQAKNGHVPAAIFLLTNVMPDKYKHISKITGGNMENELMGKTNEELLRAIVEMSNRLGIEMPKLDDDGGSIEDIDYDDYEDETENPE
jgi:hypothetical protein